VVSVSAPAVAEKLPLIVAVPPLIAAPALSMVAPVPTVIVPVVAESVPDSVNPPLPTARLRVVIVRLPLSVSGEHARSLPAVIVAAASIWTGPNADAPDHGPLPVNSSNVPGV